MSPVRSRPGELNKLKLLPYSHEVAIADSYDEACLIMSQAQKAYGIDFDVFIKSHTPGKTENKWTVFISHKRTAKKFLDKPDLFRLNHKKNKEILDL